MNRNPKGQFQEGEHWREPKPFWYRNWLYHEYVEAKRSAFDIAQEFGVTENAILFHLKKWAIPTRNVSEARKAKYWGSPGESNPMFGKVGILNPNWRGGLSPYRQALYSTHKWKTFSAAIHKRDQDCRMCGSTEKLEIHHIEPFSLAPLLVMDIGNALLLCAKCHRRLRGRELWWRKKLRRLVREK